MSEFAELVQSKYEPNGPRPEVVQGLFDQVPLYSGLYEDEADWVSLSDTETDIITLASLGMNVPRISEEREVRRKTVHNQLGGVYLKLGSSGLIQAVAIAEHRGIIGTPLLKLEQRVPRKTMSQSHLEIVQGIVFGLGDKQIARARNTVPKTTSNHIRDLGVAVGVLGKLRLRRWALENDLATSLGDYKNSL